MHAAQPIFRKLAMLRLAAFFSAALLVCQFPAAPLLADDWATCTDASGDESIAACTRAIASGRGRGAQLARAYNSRGYALDKKGDYDRAIGDCGQAIRLDPNSAAAYVNRGRVYSGRREYDLAIADYDQAIRLDPQNIDARAERSAAQGLLAPARIPSASAATLDRRVALVIGNSAYSALTAIPNPRNDAREIGDTLKALGFEVLLGIDLKRADMEDFLIRFSRSMSRADTALVYYAGHGLQHNGINYLVPVDARIEDEANLRRLFNLQAVIDDLQNAGRVRILMVDACRDNNIVQQLARRLPATRSSGLTRGLARIEGADGTLIAFATQPNRVAIDGDGQNSPFARALLRHLPTPDLELRTLMTRVRTEVVNLTAGAQRPEVWDSLVGEFIFKKMP
jgi:tetratricopeptide (TPR) repeat protein